MRHVQVVFAYCVLTVYYPYVPFPQGAVFVLVEAPERQQGWRWARAGGGEGGRGGGGWVGGEGGGGWGGGGRAPRVGAGMG